jgi:predicted small secreted protein
MIMQELLITVSKRGAKMTPKTLRLSFLAFFLASFGAAGTATAGGVGRDCSPLGTWLEVNPYTHVLAGFLSTTDGQSSNEGTIILENPGFGLTLFGLFPEAVAGSGDRGVWKRIGGNTFKYSLMGTAVNSSGEIEWIRKISGTVTILDDCKTEKITAVMLVYLGTDNPFEGTPLYEFDLGDLYAYRLTLP